MHSEYQVTIQYSMGKVQGYRAAILGLTSKQWPHWRMSRQSGKEKEVLHKPMTSPQGAVCLGHHFRDRQPVVEGRAEERVKFQCPESHTKLQLPTQQKAKSVPAVPCIF